MKKPILVGVLVAALAVLVVGVGRNIPAARAQSAGDFCGDGFLNVPDAGPIFNFSTPCALHDACYAEGGTEDDRLACDNEFVVGMFASCNARWPADAVKRSSCYSTALLYYLGVRLFGWLSFNYGP